MFTVYNVEYCLIFLHIHYLCLLFPLYSSFLYLFNAAFKFLLQSTLLDVVLMSSGSTGPLRVSSYCRLLLTTCLLLVLSLDLLFSSF